MTLDQYERHDLRVAEDAIDEWTDWGREHFGARHYVNLIKSKDGKAVYEYIRKSYGVDIEIKQETLTV